MEQPDFTHDYLRSLLKTPHLMIICPAGPVTALAVSPDGARIASGHADGTLAVWDHATGKQIGTVKAHIADVTHVAFALGGTRLFTVGKGKGTSREAFGWVVATSGELAPAPDAHRVIGRGVHCLVVSPDGQVVYAGGIGSRLFKIHLTDAKQSAEREYAMDGATITAVAISPSGKTVFTAAKDEFVRRWTSDLKAQPNRDRIRVEGEVTALAHFADEMPSVGCADGRTLMVTPVGAGSEFDTGVRVQWIATAPNSPVVQNGSSGRVLFGRLTELPTGDTGEIRAGVFSPDGKTLFTGSHDGIIRAWNISSDLSSRGVRVTGRIASIGISSNGASVVVADEQVKRYDGKLEGKPLEYAQRAFRVIRVQEDGKECGIAFEGHTVVLCDLKNDSKTSIFQVAMPGNRLPSSAALNPAGTHIAVGDDTGRVFVWAVGNPNPRPAINTGLRRPVQRVVLSDDGLFVAAPIPTGVSVWNSTKSEQVFHVTTEDSAVFRFLPGDRLATAGRDGIVKVWNFTGHEDLTLFGHVGRVTGLGVSSDGRTLVSGAATGEVKMWDLRTGAELFNIRRHSTPVTVIEFASGSRLLVTGGDGQLAVWDARE
jgi:WD40 repeat protein